MQVLVLVLLASCKQLSLGGSTTTSASTTGGTTSPSAPSGERVSADTSAGAPSGRAHDRFAVQDVKIGMPVDGRPGFTCAKQVVDPGLKDQSRKDRHCVKFVDKRCEGRPASIGTKRYGEKAPLGCYLDYSASATYLDDTLLQEPNTGDATQRTRGRKPLHNLYITGTKSEPSKIYQIVYMFAPDELTEDSKLYAALVAKYGEPSSKNPPHEMRWRTENTEVKASCVADQNCQIRVEDSKFEELENRKQEEIDGRTRRQNAPDAPKL
jgi:hypothetical protein